MDAAHEVRVRGGIDYDGMRYLANLPDSIVIELMTKHNLNILKRLSPEDDRKFNRLLETEYARFKMTDKRLFIAR